MAEVSLQLTEIQKKLRRIQEKLNVGPLSMASTSVPSKLQNSAKINHAPPSPTKKPQKSGRANHNNSHISNHQVHKSANSSTIKSMDRKALLRKLEESDSDDLGIYIPQSKHAQKIADQSRVHSTFHQIKRPISTITARYGLPALDSDSLSDSELYSSDPSHRGSHKLAKKSFHSHKYRFSSNSDDDILHSSDDLCESDSSSGLEDFIKKYPSTNLKHSSILQKLGLSSSESSDSLDEADYEKYIGILLSKDKKKHSTSRHRLMHIDSDSLSDSELLDSTPHSSISQTKSKSKPHVNPGKSRTHFHEISPQKSRKTTIAEKPSKSQLNVKSGLKSQNSTQKPNYEKNHLKKTHYLGIDDEIDDLLGTSVSSRSRSICNYNPDSLNFEEDEEEISSHCEIKSKPKFPIRNSKSNAKSNAKSNSKPISSSKPYHHSISVTSDGDSILYSTSEDDEEFESENSEEEFPPRKQFTKKQNNHGSKGSHKLISKPSALTGNIDNEDESEEEEQAPIQRRSIFISVNHENDGNSDIDQNESESESEEETKELLNSNPTKSRLILAMDSSEEDDEAEIISKQISRQKDHGAFSDEEEEEEPITARRSQYSRSSAQSSPKTQSSQTHSSQTQSSRQKPNLQKKQSRNSENRKTQNSQNSQKMPKGFEKEKPKQKVFDDSDSDFDPEEYAKKSRAAFEKEFDLHGDSMSVEDIDLLMNHNHCPGSSSGINSDAASLPHSRAQNRSYLEDEDDIEMENDNYEADSFMRDKDSLHLRNYLVSPSGSTSPGKDPFDRSSYANSVKERGAEIDFHQNSSDHRDLFLPVLGNDQNDGNSDNFGNDENFGNDGTFGNENGKTENESYHRQDEMEKETVGSRSAPDLRPDNFGIYGEEESDELIIPKPRREQNMGNEFDLSDDDFYAQKEEDEILEPPVSDVDIDIPKSLSGSESKLTQDQISVPEPQSGPNSEPKQKQPTPFIVSENDVQLSPENSPKPEEEHQIEHLTDNFNVNHDENLILNELSDSNPEIEQNHNFIESKNESEKKKKYDTFVFENPNPEEEKYSKKEDELKEGKEEEEDKIEQLLSGEEEEQEALDPSLKKVKIVRKYVPSRDMEEDSDYDTFDVTQDGEEKTTSRKRPSKAQKPSPITKREKLTEEEDGALADDEDEGATISA